MITLFFGETPHTFPNKWEELSQDQFLALAELIMKYYADQISMCQLRLLWFKKIAGLDQVKVPRKATDRFIDNVLTASRQFDFFYKLDYAGQIDSLSPETKKLIRKTPPDEINSSSGEIRYARKLEYTYQLDAVWAKNLIPSIRLNRKTSLNGWTATLDTGTLRTSLTSMQYTMGYDLLSLISSGGGRSAMILLAALLYDIDHADTNTLALIGQLPDYILHGVVLNFQAFVSFVFSCTHFSILWNTDGKPAGESAKKEISLAMSDSMYSLCKNGYGNFKDVENMPMMTFLSIMRSDLINAIRSMSASGTETEKIAEQTHLPYEQIRKILC